MRGLMMDRQLTIRSLVERAALLFPAKEIVSRNPGGAPRAGSRSMGSPGSVSVRRASSCRSMAAVAPHTVSPTSSKKYTGRESSGPPHCSSRNTSSESSSDKGTCSTSSTSTSLPRSSGRPGRRPSTGTM